MIKKKNNKKLFGLLIRPVSILQKLIFQKNYFFWQSYR